MGPVLRARRIAPHTSWIPGDWAIYGDYRDLLWLMVRRDFVSKYTQTWLGPLWFLLQPLTTMLLFLLIFSKTLKISTNGIPEVLFYLSGLLAWGYVSSTFSGVSRCLIDQVELCKRVYFPRIFLPISIAISGLVALAIQLVIFLIFRLFFEVPSISAELIWFPLVIVEMVLLSLGLGLIFAALTVKHRDLHHVSAFLLTLWMYASPIAYPVGLVPAEWKSLFQLNPVCFFVAYLRDCFLGSHEVTGTLAVNAFFITMGIFIFGFLLFSKAERNFIDAL